MATRRRFLAVLGILSLVACASSKDDDARAPGNAAGLPGVPGATAPAAPAQSAENGTEPPVTPAASGVVPVTPSEPPGPPHVVTTERMDVFGKPRELVLAVPKTYTPSKKVALVMVLHGDGGYGADTRGWFPIEAAAGQAAIAVYPTGLAGRWNLYAPDETNEDVTFLTGIVDDLRGRYAIGDVFAAGFSAGAFMVNQLACRRPALFRGISPHSGGAPFEPENASASRWENDYTRCPGQSHDLAPAVLVIHGKDDGVVTYDSGDFTAMYWSFINGCGAGRSAPAPALCVGYDGCAPGRPVAICGLENFGHAVWPDAAKTAWTFFSAL